MSTKIFPWHGTAWQQLQHLRARLPHAILFHGNPGIGKTAFAEAFAASLLCENRAADGHACGTCLSCGWFDQYSHPDYRRIRPEVLDGDDSEGEEENPDASDTKKPAKAAKALSKDIRIEQIRALGNFMNLSTHRQGKRVVLLYPAEAMNSASANALLKTLEEPPPETVFLVVSNSLDRLLPTILSRCRQFALPMPPHAQGLAWLEAQQIKEANTWLAEQGGAPLAALALAQTGARDAQDELLTMLGRPSVEAALKTAERLQKWPVVDLVVCLQRWTHDLCSLKLSGKLRYYPKYLSALSGLADQLSQAALLQQLGQLGQRRAVAEHPLSAKLFIEDMLLDYVQLFSQEV